MYFVGKIKTYEQVKGNFKHENDQKQVDLVNEKICRDIPSTIDLIV